MSNKDLENRQDQHAFILFMATQGIGNITAQNVLNHLHRFQTSWSEFLTQKESYWQSCGLKPSQSEELKKMLQKYSPEAYQQKLDTQHISVLLPSNSRYPELLHQTSDKPYCLFLLGDQSALTKLQFSKAIAGVVGTRKITEYGKFVTEKITKELCALDATIVSGFMYG